MSHYRLTLGDPDREIADPAIEVVPVPYDRTACFQAGARSGPDAILRASVQMEFYDEVLQCDPSAFGIVTRPPLEPRADGPRPMLDSVRDSVASALAAGRIPLVLGGDHSVTIGAVEAVHAHNPGVSVLHLDAHADLRDRHEESPWSHACVMRRVRECVPAVSIGIRSFSEEEAEFMAAGGISVWSPREARRTGWDLDRLLDGLRDPVYVTLDVDVFDPSVMPSTGTPEPGGLAWDELDDILAAVAARHRIVGADVVELMPIPGMIAPDYLAARLAYRLAGRAVLSQRR